MKEMLFESAVISAISLLLALMLIPVLIKFSVRLGLTDKPGHRKIHSKPIPVVGGIAIAASCMVALLLSKTATQLFFQYPVLISGSILLMLTGVWDDRKNIRPLYRLLLQILCAAALASSGIRISSLYGLLGIEQLNFFWQYTLTIIIITGVTNAFNLMDGIDGLAGGLALINLVILALISFFVKQYAVFILLTAVCGALLGFLKFNHNPARIFMGDGGSLMLGFLMSSTGILLIETGRKGGTMHPGFIVLVVCSILAIPVFDSLRVYAGRIQRGGSPFKGDKTHLHHLFLNHGLNHKKTAWFIYGVQVLLLLTGLVLQRFVSLSVCLLSLTIIFFLVCQLLQFNNGWYKWPRAWRKMQGTH